MLSLALGALVDAVRGRGRTRPAPPAVRGALADLNLPLHAGEYVLDASSVFSGAGLSFRVTGEGVAIDPATGALSIATDKFITGTTITVTAANPGGSAVSRFRLSVAALEIAPALIVAPALAGSGAIGAPVTVDPGQWGGVPAPALALQWLLDGAAIPGATGPSYTPQPADDGKALSARVTATNPSGVAEAVTASVPVVQGAPAVAGELADLVLDAGSGPVTVDAAAVFAGTALTYAVSGAGGTIDSTTGLVTIATDAILEERITVTATNSGGSAAASFRVTVRATAPVPGTPGLAGSGAIGAPVTVDPGQWGGVPAPVLALQWLRAGAAIPGATGASYTPVAADDGKALACRITGTNPAGSAEAVTAAIAVAYAPPAVVAALPDLALEEGAGKVVDARPAFAGAGLSFAVAGGGATIDAQGRVSLTAAAVGEAMVTVTATNSGGSAVASFRVTVRAKVVLPLLVTAPAIAGAGKIGQPVTLQPGTWSGVPAPSLAFQWLRAGAAIPGATGASYTPVAADDGKALSARVTATNLGGSAAAVTATLAVTYRAPTAKGELDEEIFDLGSGVQTVAAAADFTGENLTFTVSGAGATIGAKTGLVSIPTAAAVQATVTVTATNSGGSASSSFQVTVEAEDIPFALEMGDVEIATSVWRPDAQETWLTPVVRFPGLAGETVAAIEWTTGKDPVSDAQYEVVTKVGNSYQLFMRDPAKNAPGASPRVDYSVFKLDETSRRQALRFRWRRTAQGPWSGLSPAFSVPAVPAPAAGWLPLVARNKTQFEAGEVGGPGYQFLRSFATTPAAPGLLLAAMDQNFPWQSNDFGKSFFTPEWNGLWVGRAGASAWVDPEDANRQLLLYSAGSQSFNAAFDAYSGAYLSTDGGQTATRVLSLPLLTSSNMARHNMQLIAHAPGGTPTTRTIYLMQVSHASNDANAETIQLWRSTDGGATWAKRGSALPVATHAGGKEAIWGIAVAPNGDLYQWGKKGAWRSKDGGASWTKLSTLPSGEVHDIDVAHGGGVVWAAVDGAGLYKATDGASFSKVTGGLPNKGALTIAVSPADRKYMVVRLEGSANQWYSHDGGATWKEGTTHPALGQEDNFSHKLASVDHGWVVPKTDDRNVFFFHRDQHMGLSTDGGVNVHWAGRFYDGTHTRDIGFHPTDWKTFAQAQQDRALVLTQTGGDYWLSDRLDKNSPEGQQITTAVDWNQYLSGGTTLFHASGRVVTQQGSAHKRVPVIMEAANGHPLGALLVKTDCVSSISEVGARLDPHNGDIAFTGRYRVGNLGAAAMSGVSFTAMAHHFVGASGAGGATTIYGVDNGTDRTIYRSTDRGVSWTAWHVAAASFRPVDPSSPTLAVCPHHPARVYAVSGAGKVVRIEGTPAPKETLVFDAQTYLGAGLPKYAVNSIAVDPFDQDLLYVSLFMWGVPNVFRSTDRGATWEDISGSVPSLDGVIFIHPLTSDVFFGSSHGSYVLPPPAGHRQAFGIANSVYDRVQAFLASR
jgi:hypothetical protein